MDYLLAFPPKILGGLAEPRLEEISKEEPSEWHVMISYKTQPELDPEKVKNAFARSISAYRLFKVFTVDAESGRVIAMKNPSDED